MVLQTHDGARTAEICATLLDEMMMEGKTRISKDTHSSELCEGTRTESKNTEELCLHPR